MTQATISIDPKTIWRRYNFTYEVSRLRPKSPRFSTRTRTDNPAKAVHRAHSITCSAGHIYHMQCRTHRRHPDWPVVVAQTGLHRLYPVGTGHPKPMPRCRTRYGRHLLTSADCSTGCPGRRRASYRSTSPSRGKVDPVYGQANNPQQSWGFGGKPPEAVIKEFGTRDGTS
jgi:hypothetical protein